MTATPASRGSFLRHPFRALRRGACAATLALAVLALAFASELHAAAPTASNNTVTTSQGVAHTFTAADFNFADTDAGDSLVSVKIVTLPGEGSLAHDGTAVVVDQAVTKADIDADKLVFTPDGVESGSPYASFTFKVSDGTDESASAYTITINVTLAPTACDTPDFLTRRSIWTGDMTVGAVTRGGATVAHGFSSAGPVGSLVPANFAIGANTYTVDSVIARVGGGSDGDLYFSLTGASNPTDAEEAVLRLHVCNQAYDLAVANSQEHLSTYSWMDSLNWSGETARTLYLSLPANTAPTASNNTVTTNEDTGRTFTAADFGFVDADTIDRFASVKIVTLPGAGSLTLDGTAVVVDQVIAKAGIDAAHLRFTPAANANGDAYAMFTFKVSDGTDESATANTMTVDVTAMNDPVTGRANIVVQGGGRLEVGATLVPTLTIADADGIGAFSYQWIRVDGVTETDISGATELTYELTDDDAGKVLKVRVSFTDDGGNDESLDSAPTATVLVAVTPTVTLVLSPASIPENAGTSTVTATLDTPSRVVTTIVISAVPVMPAVAADFSLSGTTLTITAGDTTSSGTVTITAANNNVDALNKTVTVSGIATNTVGVTGPDPQTLTITDDDAASTTLTLSVAPASIPEDATGGDRIVTVTAALDGSARSEPTDVAVSVAADTATLTTDFAAVVNFTITIPAGMTSEMGTFTLVPADDNIDEPDETVAVRGTTTVTGLSVLPAGGATVMIADDDNTPQVTLALGPASVSEDGGVSTVTATLDRPSSETTTVQISAAPVAPAIAADYLLTSNKTLTFAPGVTVSTGTVRITARDNDTYTGNKQVTVQGTAANTMAIEQPVAQTLTIEEDDTESMTVTLSVSPDTVSEGATGNAQRVTVTAALDAAARPEATAVSVRVEGDTAEVGTDFAAVSEFTITIPVGMTSHMGTFTLAPVDDSIDEPEEAVQVSGTTTVSGLSVEPAAGLSVTISDNDPAPQVSLVLTPASISEASGASTVTATLDRPSSAETTITVAAAAAGTNTAAADFSLSGTTLTIAAGATMSTGTVTIAAANDNSIADGAKAVTVSGTVMNTQGFTAPASQTLTITDDEVAATGVTLTVSPGSVSESAGEAVTVTATLNGAAGTQPVSVAISVVGGTATVGTDFGMVTGFTIAIPASVTVQTGTFTLTPIDDNIDEPDETVTVSGTATGLRVSSSTVTIADDDATPKVSLILTPDSIPENGGTSTVTATLDGPSSEATVITVTATPVGAADANDFTQSGTTLTIAAGAVMSTGTVTIAANDNAIDHPNRQVTVSGSAANDLMILQPDPVNLTITDEEQTSSEVVIVVSPTSVSEGATGSARLVTITGTLDKAARETATVVTLSVSGGTATVGTDFTAVQDFELTIPARATEGMATFDLIPINDDIDEPDESLMVRGRSTDLAVDDSGGIEVLIADNDATPQVTLVLMPETIAENGGTSTVTATLDHPSSEATEITVSATPVNPAVAMDFSLSGTILTIAAGATTSTGTVTIAANDNEIDHPDREVTVSGSATNDLMIEQPAFRRLTIADNEQTSTRVTLSLSLTNVSEGDPGRTVTVTGTLDAAARETDAEVLVSVHDDTTKAGDDFTFVQDFTLTIPARATTGTAEFTLSPIDDNIDEHNETLLVFGNSLTAGLSVDQPPNGLTMTITDNDAAPRVTLHAEPSNISEDGGASTITATLDRPSGAVTTIEIFVQPGVTITDSDYAVSSNKTLTIAAEETESTGRVTVTGVDNDVDDTSTRLAWVMGTARNDVGIGMTDIAILTIDDDEAGSSTVVLRVAPSRVSEGASETVVMVTASLNGAARAAAIPVTVSVTGGTATSGTDYAPVSNFTITIPANGTSQTGTFTLIPMNDDIDEPNETVSLNGRASGLANGTVTVTIEDDDATPTVTLTLSPAAISENGGSSTVTATLDQPSSEDTTIEISAAPVNPAVAADFSLGGNTTLTIPATETTGSGTVTIAANDNETYTGDKSVTVSGTATNGYRIGQPAAKTLTIEEDDTESTQVTFSISPNLISESSPPSTVTVTAMLDGAARPTDTEAMLTVEEGTAEAGKDFSAVPGFTLTILAGQTSGTATFTLTPLHDITDDPDVTVEVRLPASLASSALTVAPADGLEVTIEDDDPTPQVRLVLTPASISENGGGSVVTAVLDRPSDEDTEIEVSMAPVDPAVGADFSSSGAFLIIASGDTTSTGTVTITANDNEIDHPDREVTVTGVADNNLGIEQPEAETLTIADDEATSAVVQLTVESSTAPNPVAEGASATVTVTATLDAAAREQDAVIDVVVSGESARAGSDFSAVSDFTVTIPAGRTSGTATFTLTTLDDQVKEADETVLVRGTINGALTEGPSLRVEPADGRTVAIRDDDPDPVMTLELVPAFISESGGVGTVRATLDRPYSGIVTVRITATPGADTDDDDFILAGTSLTFAEEETVSSGAAVTITGVDNDEAGSLKTVTVAGVADVSDVVQPAAKILTITDDDTPSTGITLTVSPDRVSEDATGSLTVTATLNGAPFSSDTEVTVSVVGVGARAGTDFEAVENFTITIAEDTVIGRHTFTLTPIDDETDEPDRDLLVRGATAAQGLSVEPPAGVFVTIEDDDPAPVVTLALAPAEIRENGGESTVTATLDRPSSAVITVEVTAAPVTPAVAGDFGLSGNRRLTIAAGQTASSGTVTVAAVDNDIAAEDRQVEVSGTARTNDTDVGVVQPEALTLTIENDEEPSTEVTLSLSPAEISEGATGSARTVTVTAELNGAARPTETAVAIAVDAGTALQGTDFAAVSDFTVTIPAGQRSGSAAFTLTPLDDVIDEPDETVRVTGSLSRAALAELTLVQPLGGLTVTIKDNEPEPTVTLVLTPDSIREDGGSTAVTATLDTPSTVDTLITVSAMPVTPAVADDFRLVGMTLIIPDGTTESTGTVTIMAVDNDVDAPSKQVRVSATAENAFGVADPVARTLTITDDDFPSTTVTLSVSPSEVQEGDSRTVTVTAELDGAARSVETEIAVTVSAGTAAATDFAPVSSVTLTILAEQKSGMATFTLDTVDDDIDEPDETVVVRGTTASALSVLPATGLSVTISDDDPAPQVRLVLTPDSISENGGSSTVKATLDHPSSQSTTVTVTATAQTPAVAGDFRLRGTRLTISAGQTESTGSVTIAGVNNELTAPSKRVAVSGVAENAQGIGQPQAVDLTITDDDQPSTMVTLTVSPDRVAEDGGAKRLTITGMLDGAPESADTVVMLTVNAGAAEAVEATLTIPTGRRSANAVLTLTPVDNAIDADHATVRVNASTTSSLALNPSSLEVTVTDDDERGVTVSAPALTVREGPNGGATYTVVLGSQPTSTVTVTPSAQSPPSGANLTMQPSSLSFTASNWNEPQTVTVTAQDDQDVEEDAVVELIHTVSGGDYGSNNVASSSVTVTVLGFEEDVDGKVKLKVPMTGDRVVTVPEGTSVPAGTRVTLPSAGGTVEFAKVADDHMALDNPPRGFRSGDAVVDIDPDPPLAAGQTATVCLPATSGGQRVHRWDEDTSEWVELDAPAGGSPAGLACGVTDHFSLFTLGMAPNETVAKAWVARFGRTVAQHVVDGVQSRLTAPRVAGLHGTLAGQGFGGPATAVPNGPDAMPGWPETGPGGMEDDLHAQSQSVTGRELLTGSAFALTGTTDGGGSAAVWGRGMHTRFEGSDGDASLDGGVSTGLLGADYAVEHWTAGMALSFSEGSGTYQLEDRKDELKTSLTGLYPYFGYEITERLSVWGAAGYGTGSLTLTPDRGDSTKTDLSLSMAAVGARGDLISGEGADDFALALETDVFMVRTSVDAAEGLEAVNADASRLRLGLEGSWTKAMGSGGESFTPSLKIGVRQDGGDAETGFGVEIGGGVAWTDTARGLSGEFDVHGLLMHEANKFEEQGISGSVSWDRDQSSEQGLAVTVRQSLGAEAAGGAGGLLEQQTMAGLRQADGAASAGRLDAKLGYGLPMLGNRLTGTPWLGLGLSGNGRDYTLGWRLSPSGGTGFDLGLEATRRESANDDSDPEDRLNARLSVSW